MGKCFSRYFVRTFVIHRHYNPYACDTFIYELRDLQFKINSERQMTQKHFHGVSIEASHLIS